MGISMFGAVLTLFSVIAIDTTVALRTMAKPITVWKPVQTPPTYTEESGQPVFYTSHVGTQTVGPQASVWLSSLRSTGKATGIAVIATDYPECLSKALASNNLIGELKQSSEYVDIFEPAEGNQGAVHIIKLALQEGIKQAIPDRAAVWANLEKAHIPHNISSVIYMDINVFVGQSLNEFMNYVQYIEKYDVKGGYTMALFKPSGTDFHTGTAILLPASKEGCLRKWQDNLMKIVSKAGMATSTINTPQLLDSAYAQEDRTAMLRTEGEALAHTKECRSKDGIKNMPLSYFTAPTWSALQTKQVYPIMHFGKKINKAYLKKYFQALNISQDLWSGTQVECKALEAAFSESARDTNETIPVETKQENDESEQEQREQYDDLQ